MKHLMTVLALAAAAFSTSAYATTHKEGAAMKEPTAQQGKMAMCNKEAGEKKGDERKAFMKTCLSAKKETQQDKMKSCNASAKGKAGDERKAFMKECLSK
jgi:psiF repeat